MSVLKARIGGQWVAIGGGSDYARWNSAWGVVAVGSMVQALAPWNLPAGTVTQITNSLSVTLTSGRRYRVRFICRAMTAQGAAATSLAIVLRNGTTSLSTNDQFYAPQTGNFYTTVAYDWLITGDDTTKSLNVAANGPSVIISLWTDADAQFYVEDVGSVAGAVAVPNPTPAWLPFPFAANWQNYPGFQAAQYRRIGDIVHLRGLAQQLASAGTTIGTLPVGYRPPASILFPVWAGDPGASVRMDINASGVVSANVPIATSNYCSLSLIHFSVTSP